MMAKDMTATHAGRRAAAARRREDQAHQLLIEAGYVVLTPEAQAMLLADGFPVEFLQAEYGLPS